MYNIWHLVIVFLCGIFVGGTIFLKYHYRVCNIQLTEYLTKSNRAHKSFSKIYHAYTSLYEICKHNKLLPENILEFDEDILLDKQLKNIKNTWYEKDEKT